MAIGGRPRPGKRNASSSSYASTITTVAFIALCVVGVWMLTSNSVEPPQTTNRTGKLDTSDTTEVPASELPAAKKDTPVYEDNPGDLPADAIKSDEPKSNEESENDKKDADGDGGGAIEDKAAAEQESSSSQDDAKPKDSSSEEKDMQAEKQTQVSEESTVTQNQQVQETSSSSESEANQEDASQNQQQADGGVGGETSMESQNTQNPDEKNQQQEQKDEQQIGNGGGGQESQNLKNFEEIQHKQRLEDAGLLTGTNAQNRESSQNVQEDDQIKTHTESQDSPQNVQEQKQQKQKRKEKQARKQIPQESEDLGHPEIKQEMESVNVDAKTETTTTNVDAKADTTTTANMDAKTDVTTATEQDKANEVSFPGGGVIRKESKESKKSWSTQVTESENQKERRKDESESKESIYGYSWQLCNVTAGADYIPCLDNEKALRQLHTTRHYEHRERHCPEEAPTCLVSPPQGYKRPIPWPQSRDKIWYHNVPHTLLAEVKGHQNWVKMTGEFLTFPGGGTQFIHGALHYIDFVQEAIPEIAWGKRTRVILDVGCGVASFGGYLFERDVLTMSFAPKDEHEAQVQFALERGIPAISAVMGSQRLPFPSMVFDVVHCARCRVPWHAEGGLLLLELNRVLRPGGFFVWSATPVYQKLQEDVEIWEAMSALTASMCWELVTIRKDKLNSVGAAIYRKPTSNECYDQRKHNTPPMCKDDDDPNAAWYVPLQACMHRVPADESLRGNKWPEEWPSRVMTPPYWLNSSQMGIYGKPAPQDFAKDYEHWKHVVAKTYMKNIGISWSNVRNVMDMRAVYGGFAAALRDHQVWVMNVVNVDSPDTLPIIYERGLFGIYHDWCESFSTYPRTYDLLHADHLFSILKKRCKLAPVLAEIDRIVRPGGKLIVRDESSAIGEVENLLKSLRWEVHLTFSKDQEGLLSAQKGNWRPQTYAASS